MGICIIAVIAVLIFCIYEREGFSVFILLSLFSLCMAFILTGILNICLINVPQSPHLIAKTKQPLRTFEYNCFLVNTGKYINYIIDTEAGIEIKSVKTNDTVIHYTEGEPCVYTQLYTFNNKILNFFIINMYSKKAFYIPQDTTIANYYMNLEGG